METGSYVIKGKAGRRVGPSGLAGRRIRVCLLSVTAGLMVGACASSTAPGQTSHPSGKEAESIPAEIPRDVSVEEQGGVRSSYKSVSAVFPSEPRWSEEQKALIAETERDGYFVLGVHDFTYPVSPAVLDGSMASVERHARSDSAAAAVRVTTKFGCPARVGGFHGDTLSMSTATLLVDGHRLVTMSVIGPSASPPHSDAAARFFDSLDLGGRSCTGDSSEMARTNTGSSVPEKACSGISYLEACGRPTRSSRSDVECATRGQLAVAAALESLGLPEDTRSPGTRALASVCSNMCEARYESPDASLDELCYYAAQVVPEDFARLPKVGR